MFSFIFIKIPLKTNKKSKNKHYMHFIQLFLQEQQVIWKTDFDVFFIFLNILINCSKSLAN